MKNKFKEIVRMEFIDGTKLYEMANLTPDITGLDSIIWVDTNKYYQHGGHFKRLKAIVKNGKNDRYISYSLIDGDRLEPKGVSYTRKDLPRDEKKIKNFILNNQKDLLDLSDGIISIDDFLSNINKLNESISSDCALSGQDILENEFTRECYNHIWEDNDDLMEDEEMDFLFSYFIINKKNEDILEGIYDNAINKYLNGVDIDTIITETISECYPFVDNATKYYQENNLPLDDIDLYALAEYTTRYMFGYEV